MKTDLFQSCGHCWVSQICWHIECSTFTASSFRTWNSSADIPSPPLALFIVILLKACLTLDSRMSDSMWMITQTSYLGHSVQFISVSQLCLTFCDPTDCSMPCFPVHHQLPELAQTHIHWVSDAIQPSHPLLSPSPPAFNLSQLQGIFKWVSSLHQVAKVLEFQLQHQSLQ